MFDRLLKALNALGAAWIFALMFLVCAEIASRFLFNTPIRGVAEIAGLSVVAITMLQLPQAVRGRRLARADVLIERIHARAPAWGAWLEALFALLGAAVFAALVWASATGLMQAWRTGDQFGAQGTFTFPKWPLWLVVLIGATCVVFVLLLQAWSDVRRRAPRAPAPPPAH